MKSGATTMKNDVLPLRTAFCFSWAGRCIGWCVALLLLLSVTGTACTPEERIEPLADNLLLNPGFEDGTDGWFPVGSFDMSDEASIEPASGCRYLLATNRTELWQGPGVTVGGLMTNGQRYRVSAWVRLSGLSTGQVVLTLKQTDEAGVRYAYPAATVASDQAWTRLSGYHPFVASGAVSEVVLYVEQAGGEETVAPALLLDEVILEPVPAGTTCYVDRVTGDDTNPGYHPDYAWRSGTAVTRFPFLAGDELRFRSGQTFRSGETIELRGDGTVGNPVYAGAYGTDEIPRIEIDATSPYQGGMDVIAGSFFIEGIEIVGLSTSPPAEFGLRLNSPGNIVKDVSVSGTGYGISVGSTNQHIEGGVIKDLLMLVNDPSPDNDYGAIGILLHDAAHTTVKGVHFERLRQPSIDYVTDGCAVECYGAVQDIKVSGCRVEACQSLTELGSSNHRDTIASVRFYHNLILETTDHFGFIHNSTSGSYSVQIDDIRFENNTVIKQSTERTGFLIGFDAFPEPDRVYFRNNILSIAHLENWAYQSQGMRRANNLYDLDDTPGFNFALTNGEQLAEACFAQAESGDFNPGLDSPALDAGANLGYLEDYSGRPIPQGAAPDIGAFERPDTADYDGDGMDDYWEMEQFGSLITASAASDYDGDGMLDIDEYVAGTQATNSLSVFRVSVLPLTANEGNRITWQGRGTNRQYAVMWTTNLTEPMQPLSVPVVPTYTDETTLCQTDTVHSAERNIFYGVRARIAPIQ